MKKHLLAAAGLVSLALGVLGIFLPILPTTCFLLFAAYCFARSSPRLHDWLLNHRWLGPRIKLYMEHRAVTRRTKIVALATLWGSILLSAILVRNLIVGGILLLVAVAVSVHLLSLKTYRLEEDAQGKEAEETPA